MSLFPLIDLPKEAKRQGSKLPLFREAAWDLSENKPIWRGGEPVYVTGADAVLVWAWNALHNDRGIRDIFTRDYGLGIRELTGRPYSEAVRRAEAVRCIRECLQVNPYITGVDAVEVSMEGSRLTVRCRINTIYGEVNIDGCTL